VKTFFAYAWAIAAVLAGLGGILGVEAWTSALARFRFMTVHPRFTGGEVVRTVAHAGYRTEIHRPVFDGLRAPRAEGFVQVRWRAGEPATWPALIQEDVAFADGETVVFTLCLDTTTGTCLLATAEDRWGPVQLACRMDDGWLVRVAARQAP
jgi:hypothetical protein